MTMINSTIIKVIRKNEWFSVAFSVQQNNFLIKNHFGLHMVLEVTIFRD